VKNLNINIIEEQSSLSNQICTVSGIRVYFLRFQVEIQLLIQQINQRTGQGSKQVFTHHGMQDTLIPAQVEKALNTVWLGRFYQYLPSATSTNDILKELAVSDDGSPMPAGSVLLTDFQERGRGRMSRSWQAPPGSSLLFSILLRPNWPLERLSWLTMIAGLAVCEAVEQQTMLTARLKWPNDCVVKQGDMWKKFCGILLEGHLPNGNKLAFSVVGIGLNVNIPEEELPPASFPATSLLVAEGNQVSRLDLLTAILSRFEYHYDLAEMDRSPHAAWQKRLIFMNKCVVVSRLGKGAEVVGTAVGTDETGRLLVRDEHGEYHHITAGDVSLRPYHHPS
jgi:BirA family transcriptional regulator, biotin operon repressor / biotin---[acetyl-CoA-carboxylase] ligase